MTDDKIRFKGELYVVRQSAGGGLRLEPVKPPKTAKRPIALHETVRAPRASLVKIRGEEFEVWDDPRQGPMIARHIPRRTKQ
jgi:hypothetical protein